VKGLLKRISLTFAAIAILLVALDIILRIVLPPACHGNITNIPKSMIKVPTVPGVQHMLRPSSVSVHEFGSDPRGYFDPGATLTYRINSHGFRGPEISADKPPDTFRIIGVGDSFTFGTGVRREDTFLAVLEAILSGPGRSVEVLNLGVMGYDTASEVNLLRFFGLKFSPDVVIVCYFMNDAAVSGPFHRAFNVNPDHRELPFWRRHSRLADVVASRVDRYRGVKKMIESYRKGYQPNAAGWVRCKRALRRARSMADKHGFRMAMMVFPMLWELTEDYPFKQIHNIVVDYARTESIPVLDLLPAFQGQDGPSLWVHPNNQHPNEEAHAIAAKALHEFLVAERLLK